MIDEFLVVDLFCGIGGLTHGFVKEGFQVAAGIDFDNSCKYAYEKNNNTQFLHKDIGALSASDLKALFGGKRKILIGCAPCQPYSIFNRKKDVIENSDADPRWKLLYSFSSLIKETRPEVISMENVPLLKNYGDGVVFNDFVKALEDIGYHISYDIFNAQDYGVPQRRKRLVLLGSLHGKIDMIAPTHKVGKYVTVRQAIGDLSPISDGEIDKKDKLHRARKLTELTKRRIQATKEGGSWKDWDEELKLACHKKEGGEKYRSVYGRMQWDDVAPTMTTYCIGLNNGRFGHPEQDRAISLREAALLQSFPKGYSLIDSKSTFSALNIAKHIGNAVPVLLGKAIAKSIKLHLNSIQQNG
ncbi:DNA cytosine methyltransferase [Niabella hirudinis]|uniref:DNA cytosine methyltransferase n=1 Tax=Niabella hirudinis TaxID=1285929 RepID=UPI003EBB02CA